MFEVDVVGQRRRHRVVHERRPPGRFDDEAMVRVEHDLVAGAQHGIARRFAVDLARLGAVDAAQDDQALLHVDARVAFRERGIVDADVAFHAAADQPRPIQREAAPVVLAADAAQQHARIAAFAAGRAAGRRVRAARRATPLRAPSM